MIDELLEGFRRQAMKMFGEATAIIILIVMVLLLLLVLFAWLEANSNKRLNRSVWLRIVKVIT